VSVLKQVEDVEDVEDIIWLLYKLGAIDIQLYGATIPWGFYNSYPSTSWKGNRK
jgi:hypothetical protein